MKQMNLNVYPVGVRTIKRLSLKQGGVVLIGIAIIIKAGQPGLCVCEGRGKGADRQAVSFL